ncbi:MAG: N-acetylmuramoyl-L-alanine amidase [Methylovulum sp.]|nr:N-acetylmuramoyl-L-alanine amidase [Methylovulum sp.]
MRNYCKILFILGLQLLSVASYAEQTSAKSIKVNSLSYSAVSQRARMSFAVTSSPKHRVFVLDNPSRLVIDIKNAALDQALNQPSPNHPLFAKVRAAAKNSTDLRIVVDLKKAVSAENFSLSTNNKDGHRLFVDLINKTTAVPAKMTTKLAAETTAVHKPGAVKPVTAKPEHDRIEPEKAESESTGGGGMVAVKSARLNAVATKEKTIVVALDAGHGGDDPGAQGPQGTEEKKVTFAIATKLAALINGQSGMKAVMIRKGDYYIGLRKRMQLARAAKADLFISIHADAFEDASVRGASVYTLSTRGASSEAAHWLAKSENASEVGGVNLSDKENVLASVLLDLSQTATQQASLDVANNVLKKFQTISVLHKESVQKAGFIVLKSPDIPSILVETAFISNPLEEQNLTSIRYQAKMAQAIFMGVRNYFRKSVPVESRMAAL